MAFLDNSGDIILDAVLTDTGRMRLARGDGSFRVAKFALGDDEIDYGLFRGSNHPEGAHPSGSAYYDLEIMQTPILEAFTNNTSLMKHKLISMPQTNLLYLPVAKLNNKVPGGVPVSLTRDPADAQVITELTRQDGDTAAHMGIFIVAANSATYSRINGVLGNEGVIPGSFNTTESTKHIQIDQGLDTNAISSQNTLTPELRETQYIIRVDDRLLKVTPPRDAQLARASFVDDDQVASYYLSRNTDSQYIQDIPKPGTLDGGDTEHRVIAGPAGTRVMFSLLSSMDIETSNFLFTTLGGGNTVKDSANNEYYFIDTSVRVSGATTGSSIDVPVRIMKNTN